MNAASRLLLLLFAAAAGFHPVWAQSPGPATRQPSGVAAPSAAPIDRYGDPLLERSLLRLGTIRLRQGQGVNGVAFTPDGKSIVSGGWQAPIRIWDSATGREVGRFASPGQTGTFGVAFSPDGTRMASVGESGSIHLWDMRTREPLVSLKGSSDRTTGVAFSPDGTVFATAGEAENVQLWDAATGTLLLELPSADRGGGNTRPVTFSPDGNLLASATNLNTIQIWNLKAGGEPILIPQAHERYIHSVLFTRDGKQLISCGSRRQPTPSFIDIHVWNVANGKKVAFWDAGEPLSGNSVLALSADGSFLVSGHNEKFVVWDVATGRPRRIISAPGILAPSRTHALAISPDNRLLASAGGSNKIYLWDLTTGLPVLPQEESHQEGVLSVAYSPDGKFVATAGADHVVHLWNAATGEHIRKIDEGTGWARYVEFFPDGARLAIGRETYTPGGAGFQGEMKICRVSDGRVLHHFLTPDRVMVGGISPDGSRLAAGIGLGRPGAAFGDGAGQIKLIVWDADLGGIVAEGIGPTSQFQQVVFANGSNELWSTGQDDVLRKWNGQNGREMGQVDLKNGWNTGWSARTLVSPKSGRAVVGALNNVPGHPSHGYLRVRSLDDPAVFWEKSFADSWPSAVAASPDGSVLAAHLRAISESLANERIVLWSMESGDELFSFDLGDCPVRSLAFSIDGKRLASGMEQGDTLIWDVSATQAEGSR